MIKVEDILNLDLDKIGSAPLKEAIKSWIKDYNKEEDKKLFAKESQENIDKLFGMAKKYAPEAIKAAEKKESKDKENSETAVLTKKLVKEVIEELTELDMTLDGEDQTIIATVRHDLEDTLGEADNSKFKSQVTKAIRSFEKAESNISESKTSKKAKVIIAKLSITPKETKPKSDESEKSQTAILTNELVREVIDELTDIEIDLEGQDETIIATTRLELEEALEKKEQSKLHKKVEKAVESFKDWAMDIDDSKAKKAAITSMNKLFNALGEPLLNADGKEQKESEKERSKRILAELQELKPELDRCRAVVSEANKKKRDAEGAKPKKTRLTQLKNKLLSIAGLIPPHLKENLDVQKKTEKILLTAHKELVSAWGMDKVKAKPGADAIKEKFDALEEKKEVKKKVEVPTETEIIKHLKSLSNDKLVNDAAYILSRDLDRVKSWIEDSKEQRAKVEEDLAKYIISSEDITTYLKEIGFKK